ncbi:MAG: MFS transporter [Chloroflexota bacterium]|nr:MFS transporter [Chloroflexota bacterium]
MSQGPTSQSDRPPPISTGSNEAAESLPPSSIELGPVGAFLGASTAADFEAESAALEEQTRRGRAVRRAAVSKKLAPSPHSLFHEEPFRIFWLARLTAQTGQGALLYALLIIVVDRTDRSLFTSLFVICSIVPSIIFGLPAGIAGDNLPRRPLLVSLNLLRFVLMLFLLSREPSLAGIFAATLALWTIHQFYSPSESATLAALVPRTRYIPAQALSNLALTLAQLLGLVILAPLLLKTVGPRALFAVCAALFIVAAGLIALLPRLDEHLSDARSGERRRSLRQSLLDGWRVVRSDRVSYEAIIDDVLVGIGASALVVILPFYLERVLGTAKENTVFVFAPAALGLVLGLRYAPFLGRFVGERRLATGALLIFAFCFGALGFVEQLHTFVDQTLRLPLDQIADLLRIPRLVSMAMLISVPAGFASALVNVAARSILLARTPAISRGQVIATQGLIGNLGALVPTLLAGIAADLFGVEPIAIAIACVIAGGALAVHFVSRQPLPFQTAPSSG